MTIVQSERAAVAAWGPAVCVGRAWTVATAKTSAVVQASASVAVALTRVLVGRFILFPSVSAGGYRADNSCVFTGQVRVATR
jgi:hypothetical protein